MHGFTTADVPDQQGRTILVTGANTGIGFEAALVLAGRGARVLLACRDRARAEAALARIAAMHPAADTAFIPLDLEDLASVRRAAVMVGQEARLDVLINNAGIMCPPLGHTRDGFERQLGINHLGHFALTALLLGKLSEGADARVVSVASLAHRRAGVDFANLDGRKGYNAYAFYGQSKLANLLFIGELDRRLRASGLPITAIACHPGVSGTDLGRGIWLGGPASQIANWIFHPPAKGAVPTLQAATDPAAEAGGYYGPQGFMEARGPSGPAKRSEVARDPALARRFWDVSRDLTCTDPGLPPA